MNTAKSEIPPDIFLWKAFVFLFFFIILFALYANEGDAKLIQTFRAPDELQENAWFGRSVLSLDGSIFIGAPGHNLDGKKNAGQVYLFDFESNHLDTFNLFNETVADSKFGDSIAELEIKC